MFLLNSVPSTRNCNFASVMNPNVNLSRDRGLSKWVEICFLLKQLLLLRGANPADKPKQPRHLRQRVHQAAVLSKQ